MKTLLMLPLTLIPALATDAPKHNVGTLTTWHEQVMPLVIVGEGWSQTFVAQCVEYNPDRRCTGALKFFTAEGEPWEVDLVDKGKADTVLFDLMNGFVEMMTDFNVNGEIICPAFGKKRNEIIRIGHHQVDI